MGDGICHTMHAIFLFQFWIQFCCEFKSYNLVLRVFYLSVSAEVIVLFFPPFLIPTYMQFDKILLAFEKQKFGQMLNTLKKTQL